VLSVRSSKKPGVGTAKRLNGSYDELRTVYNKSYREK
jgi:hypothetical protein